MVDILLSENQIKKAANGDCMIASGKESLIQDIKLEIQTNEGELFFDESYGFSLVDFLHREPEDEFLKLEIKKRFQEKLAKREEIDQNKIEVTVESNDTTILIHLVFQMKESEETIRLDTVLSSVDVKVIER